MLNRVAVRSVMLALVPCATLMAQGRPSTDVWTASLTGGDVPRVEKAVNLTHRTGYDNQPSFTPDGKAILYTAIDGNGPSDIWRVELKTLKTSNVTRTAVESEYSATPMPGGGWFSSIRVEADSTQRLWKFRMDGSDPALVLEKSKPVGYHVWTGDNTLAIYVLGNPNSLQLADARTGNTEVVANNIGRALQKIPGRNAISFQQLGKDGNWIVELDLVTHKTTPIAKCPEGGDYHIWTPGGVLLSASGSRILVWQHDKWEQAADLAADGVRNITRLAINAKGDRLAFVAEDHTTK
jgi:hypothetical protein